MGAYPGGEFWLVSARVLQVELQLRHGVGHLERLVLSLVHGHYVTGHSVVQNIVRLVYHHVQQVKPAAGTNLHASRPACLGDTTALRHLSGSPFAKKFERSALILEWKLHYDQSESPEC